MAATATATRPATCGAYNVLHPDFGSASCKRLPRHKGECRATLTVAASHRKTSPKGSAKGSPKVTTRATILTAAAQLAAGTLTPSAYMSLVSAYGQRRARKALSVKAEASVA